MARLGSLKKELDAQVPAKLKELAEPLLKEMGAEMQRKVAKGMDEALPKDGKDVGKAMKVLARQGTGRATAASVDDSANDMMQLAPCRRRWQQGCPPAGSAAPSRRRCQLSRSRLCARRETSRAEHKK